MHSLRQRAGLYSIHSFSPLCNACIIHAKLGRVSAQLKEQVWLGSYAVLKQSKLTDLFADAMGRIAGVEYSKKDQIGDGNSAYGLSLSPEQKQGLVSFLEKLQEHVADEVRNAKREGRSLLAGLARGQYTTREFDEEVKRQEK